MESQTSGFCGSSCCFFFCLSWFVVALSLILLQHSQFVQYTKAFCAMQLNETKAFSIWGTDAEVDKSIVSLSKVAISLPQVTVGGKKMSLGEVIKVAFFKALVTLDPTTLQQVGEKAKTPAKGVNVDVEVPTYQPSQTAPGASSSLLPREACRAAIFQLIIMWMQGRSGVRTVAIDFLVELLNVGCVPIFTSLANAPLELLLTLNGQHAKCLSSDGSVKPADVALRSCGLSPFVLNDIETRAILQEEFAFTGMSSFIGGYAEKTFRSLDVVAALSCEAAGVTLGDSADPAVFELLRPQRGQMASATNLKLMLDSSKNNNTDAAASDEKDAVFKAIPQIHGPAFETSAASAR
jgi:histidine ammonia-lyase